jgi:hypothetical protein
VLNVIISHLFFSSHFTLFYFFLKKFLLIIFILVNMPEPREMTFFFNNFTLLLYFYVISLHFFLTFTIWDIIINFLINRNAIDPATNLKLIILIANRAMKKINQMMFTHWFSRDIYSVTLATHPSRVFESNCFLIGCVLLLYYTKTEIISCVVSLFLVCISRDFSFLLLLLLLPSASLIVKCRTQKKFPILPHIHSSRFSHVEYFYFHYPFSTTHTVALCFLPCCWAFMFLFLIRASTLIYVCELIR